MADRIAVPGYEDVTLVKTGQSTRTLWVNTHDHSARPFAAFDDHWLEAQSEIARGDPPMCGELGPPAFDVGRWDDKPASTWPKNRHADRVATGVQHKAALSALPQT